MTWKPTDEMVKLVAERYESAYEPAFSEPRFAADTLIAVQPLIAAEAIKQFLDTEYNSCVGALVDKAAAEARAKALEEAAKVCDEKESEWDRHLDDGWDSAAALCATEIRSLIPKPVEGT